MSALRTVCLALAPLGALAVVGCGSCDTSGQDPITYRDGLTNESRTYYETSPIDGEYLHFPAGRVYELEHNLRALPFAIDAYLAFSPNPNSSNGGDGFAPSAGNQTILNADERFIFVRNDTCAEFYLRVVAFADPDAAPGG